MEEKVKVPRYVQLADVLRERIGQGVYPAGGLLPIESAICHEHQVSLMTVRRGLALLRAEGVIKTRRGVPSIVRVQVERSPRALKPGERLIVRMPDRHERLQLALDAGVPVLEVHSTDGPVELIGADRIELVGADPA